MVARIISGQSIRGLLNYNENKVAEKQATLVLASRFGTELDRLDFRAKLKRFENLTMLNAKVKTNALHIMLNFDRDDKVDLTGLIAIASTYMERIGFGGQPYLVYQHKDVSHLHLHIVTTNMQANGKRIDIHGIGRTLSETARKALEIEFNLVKAEGRRQSEAAGITPANLEKALYGKMPTKRAINNVVSVVMREYKFTSLAEYNAILKGFNVLADRGRENTIMFEKRGMIYSVTDEKGNRIGIPLKASALTGRPTLDRIEKRFDHNRLMRKPYKQKLTNGIDRILARYDRITKGTLITELKKSGISLVLRKNESGLIYGTTFIDHRHKTVFNGSDLGKAYSAKTLTGHFADQDRLKTYLKPVDKQQTYLKTELASKTYMEPLKPIHYLNDLLTSKPQSDHGLMLPRKKKKRKRGITFKK